MNETAEHKASSPPRRSRGERAFDWITYGGFAGVGTFVVTVPFAYLLKHYPPMQPYYARAVDGMHRLLTKLPFGVSRARSEQFVTTLALMEGGNAMLVPVAAMEHHKVALVEKLNHALGDAAEPGQVEQAPKQTWGSLLEGRMVAFGVVWGAFMATAKLVPKSFEMFEHEIGERVCQLFRKPTTRMVAGVEQETKTFIFGKLAALDVFATAAAALLLYVGGHFFARRHEVKREQKAERLAHLHPPKSPPSAPEAVPETRVESSTAQEMTQAPAPETKISGSKQLEARMAEPSSPQLATAG